jgi:hypothetical protein
MTRKFYQPRWSPHPAKRHGGDLQRPVISHTPRFGLASAFFRSSRERKQIAFSGDIAVSCSHILNRRSERQSLDY